MLFRERNCNFEGRFSDTSDLNSCPERQTKTGIAVLHEATIDDYWNVDEDKSLSEPWMGVTRFELFNKNPPGGHMWVQGRLTKKQVPARSGHNWPEEWSSMPKGSQRKALNKRADWTLRENNEAF